MRATGDIDCAVDGIDPSWALRLQDGWKLCHRLQYDLRGWTWILERKGRVVWIDTADDPRGIDREGFPTTVAQEGVGQAPSPVRAAYLTGKRIRKGDRSVAAWEHIGALASADEAWYRDALRSALGPRIAALVASRALRGEAPDGPMLREARALLVARRFRSPARIVEGLTRGAARDVGRLLRPTGMVVLVAGPDGSGKSTLADRLPIACTGLFRGTGRFHWRPGLLPRPGVLLGSEGPDPSRPHGRPVHGPALSLALVAYHWVDFVAGGLLRIAARRVRSGMVVVERGWWDMAVDPARYRLGVPSRVIRTLGALVPAPDLALVLEADASVLRSRKDELPEDELARQARAWRRVLPGRTETVFLDASLDPALVEDQAREAVVAALERRAVKRLGPGWSMLPSRGSSPGWMIPRGPRAAARRSLDMFQPMNLRGLAAWRLARVAASMGGFRLAPRAEAPPRAVREVLAPHIPPGGRVAVGRANHENRFLAVIIPRDGGRSIVAKVATDPASDSSLEREADAIERWGRRLIPPLSAPTVIAREPGLLLMEGLEWRPRVRPWLLEASVARGLGILYASGANPKEAAGPAHGDLAPWNLLRTTRGWVVIDWEAAMDGAPPLYDVCHFVVQGLAFLGRPTRRDLLAGFSGGAGWVGEAVSAYREGAGARIDPIPSLRAYLDISRADIATRASRSARGVALREALLRELGE
jgi:hypothetical protein